jgi:hypothetical protein
MSEQLPDGYSFITDIEVGTEELWDLFEDVAHGVEPVAGIAIIDDQPDIGVDFTADEEDISRTALGIRDDNGKLVGYVAATIDSRDMHATADCIVVHPDESDAGIGTTLADEGLRFLATQGIRSVSFQNFGQISKLLPHLIQRQNFSYDGLNEEYSSEHFALHLARGAAEAAPSDAPLAEVVEEATLQPAISPTEMIAFKNQIGELLKACVASANDGSHWPFNDGFLFELAGRQLTITQMRTSEYSEWSVVEEGAAELVASPHGVIMATEREYTVGQYAERDEPTNPQYKEVQEIRGIDGAMCPFVAPELRQGTGQSLEFNQARFNRVMATLRRLSPEHWVVD